jgi:hypothetical protein
MHSKERLICSCSPSREEHNVGDHGTRHQHMCAMEENHGKHTILRNVSYSKQSKARTPGSLRFFLTFGIVACGLWLVAVFFKKCLRSEMMIRCIFRSCRIGTNMSYRYCVV